MGRRTVGGATPTAQGASMRRTPTVLIAVCATAAVVAGTAACGSDNSSNATTTAPAATSTPTVAATSASTPGPENEAPVVKVSMGAPNEFSFSLGTKTVRPGQVTFEATNGGKMTHEMVVLKTPMPAAKLPMESAAKAKEIGHVGEIPDLPAGSTKSVTLTLRPGHYTVLCNLPGHYSGGMRADLTVK